MDILKLLSLSLAIVLFTACGSDNSEEVLQAATEINVPELDLQNELRSKEFFVIEDSIQTKNMYIMSFDENLSSWNIEVYNGDYSTEATNTVNNLIAVSNDTLTNNGGAAYKLTSINSEYTTLVANNNPLVSLRMFTSSDAAQAYYNIDLRDLLKSKEFFVVQNDLNTRTLYKITVEQNNTQWDIVSYENGFSEDPTGTGAGLAITVNDSNLTDSGGASFWLNTVEEDFFKLVSYGNSLVTLKFYESSELAKVYYDSIDLRAELKSKTFYAVNELLDEKKLIKFTINETATEWIFELYADDYNETATSSGTNSIIVTEGILFETEGDSLRLTTKTNDYIGLESLSNPLNSYRLYNTIEAAQTFYK